jgi:hypothetical protein
MIDVAEAQNLIKECFPVEKYGNRKGAIAAAYNDLKLNTIRRAETMYYGTLKRVDGWELDALRKKKARIEAHEQRRQFEATAEHLRRLDARRYRNTIDELESLVLRQGD